MEERENLVEVLASTEEEVLSGTTTCRWCEEEIDYEIRAEVGGAVTTRCPECSLKVWIRGDGWEKYKELHGLEEGCQQKEEESSIAETINDAWTHNTDGSYSFSIQPPEPPETYSAPEDNQVITEAARYRRTRSQDE